MEIQLSIGISIEWDSSRKVLYSTSIPKKIVPNKNVYAEIAVVWLTVPTLLPMLLNVAMLNDWH